MGYWDPAVPFNQGRVAVELKGTVVGDVQASIGSAAQCPSGKPETETNAELRSGGDLKVNLGSSNDLSSSGGVRRLCIHSAHLLHLLSAQTTDLTFASASSSSTLSR